MVLMDFSGIYDAEEFWKKADAVRVDVRGLPGTNCYCDDEAGESLRKKIADLPERGIHFIDSGNYHYMTFFWLEKIQEPFRLLVFDNHTDMQLPAFGDILSCGGWIAAALQKLPCLKQVILVGPDEGAWSQVDGELAKRVCFLGRERLAKQQADQNAAFFQELPNDLPLYISVDKDVLCAEDASTTWSQGDMKLPELLRYLASVWERFALNEGNIIGMDVCGECDPDLAEESMRNDAANGALLELFQGEGDML